MIDFGGRIIDAIISQKVSLVNDLYFKIAFIKVLVTDHDGVALQVRLEMVNLCSVVDIVIELRLLQVLLRD